MKKIAYLSLYALIFAQAATAQSTNQNEGVSRQVVALKNAMNSYKAATDGQINTLEGQVTALEGILTSFETCAEKRMVFIDDTTSGDEDGCATPMNGGGFDIIETSDLTATGEDVRMHRGRMYVESPATFSDDCVGRKVPNATSYHTVTGVFTQGQASDRACEEDATGSNNFTSILAKFGSTWRKIADHGSCSGGSTKEFLIELSKDKTSTLISSKVTTVNNSTIRRGHNLTMESKTHIDAPWTGDFAICSRDRYDAIGSLNILMAE